MIDEWSVELDEDDYSEFEDGKIFSLRDWQRKAKKYFFESGGKCIFEVSTGTGKTVATISILQDLLKINPGLRVLFVVPKNIILEDGWYKELVDAGIHIQKIGVYYGSTKEYGQFTLTNMQNIDRIPLEMFDMVCFDEIHNYNTPRMLEFVRYPFKFKLGLTATLKRADYKHVRLMEVFDYNVFKYSAINALNDEVLNPFIFVNIGVSLDDEHMEKYELLTQQLNTVFQSGGGFDKIMKTTSPLKMKMYSLLNERKQLINNYYEKFNIVREIISKHKDNKVIVFNQFNNQTSKLYWHLLDLGVKCRIVHSGVSKDKRDKDLIDFRNDKFNVLLTTKVLDEGYNLPKLDVAVIMAGDSTDKQTIQRVGRVLRKKEDCDSVLYQVYCKKTIEARNAVDRAKVFKKLCTDYRDVTYESGKSLLL